MGLVASPQVSGPGSGRLLLDEAPVMRRASGREHAVLRERVARVAGQRRRGCLRRRGGGHRHRYGCGCGAARGPGAVRGTGTARRLPRYGDLLTVRCLSPGRPLPARPRRRRNRPRHHRRPRRHGRAGLRGRGGHRRRRWRGRVRGEDRGDRARRRHMGRDSRAPRDQRHAQQDSQTRDGQPTSGHRKPPRRSRRCPVERGNQRGATRSPPEEWSGHCRRPHHGSPSRRGSRTAPPLRSSPRKRGPHYGDLAGGCAWRAFAVHKARMTK